MRDGGNESLEVFELSLCGLDSEVMHRGKCTDGQKSSSEPEDGKWQRFFHFLDPLLDALLSFVPDRSCLRLLRVHVGQRDRPAEVPSHRFSAVRDRVRLQPAGAGDVPMLGADWDLLAQKCARPRPASPPTSEAHAIRSKQPFHRRRAHFEQLFAHRFFEHSLLAFIVRQP